MYRLCRFFVTDITAGENLLRNGFVPIFREDGRADHGVLFAVNGTCKTTLLSFILNVFCPDQRRFVQHLQSGGDKTLEQYLIPGRPALVLLDMAILLSPTLFEREPMEHLVLGQLLYRHRSAPDKMDRTYFIAQSADFFDVLRREWDNLLLREQPYKTVRDFLAPHIQQTASQKEWADNLERLGLDPWLIDRQIDFARTEGGIKDTFKFRSETEFLSFFLGCVADMDAAATLRDTIGQSLQKMEDRPRKMAQLRAARDLKEQISDFDGIAGNWRNACDAVASWHSKLGEAAHLLSEADQAAERKISILKPSLAEAGTHRAQTLSRLEATKANSLAVHRFQLARAIETAEGEIQRTGEEIVRLEGEDKALKAAEYKAEIRKKRAEAEIKEEALLRADVELAPMLRKVEGMAAQYHVRLDDDRRQVREEIETLQDHRRDAEEVRKKITDRRTRAIAQRDEMEEKLSRAASRIQAAEAGRAALPMESGESPVNARDRLKEEIETIEDRITRIQGEMATLEEEMRAGGSRWRQIQTDRSDLEARLSRARENAEAEARERSRLLADPNLKQVAGTPTFEPTAAELVSRLDDAIARSRDRLDEKQRGRLALEGELERLGRTETLAADDQTQRLIAHYHQAGVSPGELKSFPEYLADLYEAPEEIAEFIEADPARFTGIMAATEAVMETVREVPVPEWLHRPVVISIPCPPEAVSPIGHTVIRPRDPKVYSKRHMADTKARLREELDALNQDIEEKTAALREMEKSSRGLHAYRETYPDRPAVTALAGRVKELEDALSALSAQIEAAEESMENLRERKAGQEHLHRSLTIDATRNRERLSQVKNWLSAYGDLEQWHREKEEIASSRAELDNGIASDTGMLEKIREDISHLQRDISVLETKLKGLDDRAGDVPRPQEAILSATDRESALTMDLRTLRALWETAREDQRQTASVLGIDGLQRELNALQETMAQREARYEAFRREHPFDERSADAWAARSVSEREERREILSVTVQKLRESVIHMESEIKYQRKGIQQADAELSARAKKGIRPDLAEADLTGQNPDGLLHRIQSEEARFADTHARLEERCRNLEGKLKTLTEWRQEIQLGQAETRIFAPVWDNGSPRVQWPDLLNDAADREPMEAIRSLREHVKEMIASQQEDQLAADTSRKKMSGAFDRLQGDLQSEAYRHHLPAVIDALRRHDAESIGSQGRELIQRCEEIARNIESDLEISQRIVDNLVDMLLQRSREYHQKLQAAAQETVPADVFIYGGKPILRAGTRLDFAKHREVFRQSVENWLDQLIQQNRLPEVNPRAGNCLGSELLYQLLGAASGKKEFGIHLLKCDDTGRNYEPVGKDLGSGGEALTTAVLLYSLLISMRKKRRNQTDDRIPAFLILDNPLGVCNRTDFLDAQLKVARAMGIQCVYLTGINDRESLDLFELRVAIRKGDKKLEIDGTTYDCLEITELNVEKRHGPYLA
jgi:DNA repair exonuclease SbcCD ATPase subunit